MARCVVVENTADNNIVTFRFKNADTKMQAAEEDFEIGGHKFRAGSIIIPSGDRGKLESSFKDLGLSAWATSARAASEDARTHDSSHRLHPFLEPHAG